MEKKLSPLKSIKQFCRDCNGEVNGGSFYDCLDHNCVLYPFKEGKGNYEKETEQHVTQEHKDYLKSLGKNLVKKTRVLSEEHKTKLANSRRKNK